MSTDNPLPCDYIFVDGLEPSHGFTVRSHISREVCRQRKIQQTQVYRNIPVSRPSNSPQKPIILRFGPLANGPGVRRPNHSSRQRRTIVGPGKNSLLLLPSCRQLPGTLCDEDVTVDEAMVAGYSSDCGDSTDLFDQGGPPRETGLPNWSSHGATCNPRADITSALPTDMSSRDFPCRLGAGFLDPFQDYPVQMDPLTKRLLYRRESAPLHCPSASPYVDLPIMSRYY